MPLIGLDVGERRIGIAVSDELGLFAHPRETIERGRKREFQLLRALIKNTSPKKIVIGYPLELNGNRGEKAELVEKFRDRLIGHLSQEKGFSNVPVVLWDERLTSVQAERILRGSSVRIGDRRAVTDSIAAVIILESYMQSIANGGEP